jgi:uncharacterized membrane protein YcaP (DUF421 family)
MNSLLDLLFGHNDKLNVLQMTDRAVVIFLLTMLLIRISGRRSFGMKSAVDNTIVILLGAILSRAVVGASPFLPTLSAGLSIVLLHRIFSWVALRWPRLGRIIKGGPVVLVHEGKIDRKAMSESLISKHDLDEGIREAGEKNGIPSDGKVILERNGRITLSHETD